MNVFAFLQDPAHWSGSGGILDLLWQHLLYTVGAVLLAAVVAIPLGILVGHTGRGSSLVLGLSGAARAVPALGLLFLAVMLLGRGGGNIVVVLAILALPPILTAVAAGVAGADRGAVHAGRGLGMTEGQLMARVEWPLALPRTVSGLRRATRLVVATATLAAFASAGGLGRLLTSGQAQGDYPQMFAGALLVAALAVVLDLVLATFGGLAARRARPRSRATSPVAVAA